MLIWVGVSPLLLNLPVAFENLPVKKLSALEPAPFHLALLSPTLMRAMNAPMFGSYCLEGVQRITP